MKDMAVIVTVIARLAVAAVCAWFGGVLAIDGKEGWGWFLLASIILGSITVRSKNERVEEE